MSVVEPLEERALFSTVVWSGGGSDNNWSTAANWAGGVAPVSGDSLKFSGSTRTTSNDNYSAGFSFGSIEFASTGFTLTGNQANLSGGILVDSSISSETMSLPIALTASQSVNVSSGTLTISGAISGSAALTKIGAGTVTLSGTNSYTGGTIATSGTVNVAGNQSAANGGWSIGNSIASTPVTVSFQSGSTINIASGDVLTIAQSASSASAATLNIAGSVTDNGSLTIGRAAAFNINSGATWIQTGSLSIGPAANAAYNASATINTGGTFNYSGTSQIGLSPSTGSSAGGGILSIPGGTFITNEPFNDTVSSSGGSANLLLSNSGTLQFTASLSSLTTTSGSAFNMAISSGTGKINTAGNSVTFTQPISGSGLLDKVGNGVLTLAVSNSFTGGATIAVGTVLAENSASFGTGTVTIVNGGASNASLQLSGGITLFNAFAGFNSETGGATPTLENVSGNNDIISNLSITGTGGNGVIFQSDAGTLTLSGTLTTTLTTTRDFYFQGSGNGIVSGNIVDDSSNILQIVKSGTGSWTLSGTNTYAAGTVIIGGSLSATGASVAGGINAKTGGTFSNTAVAAVPWLDSDIGAPTLAGTATFNTNNTYTVAGSGTDIAGVSDQMNFVAQRFDGDGSLVAEVNGSPVNTDSTTTTGSKDGIMIRDNLLFDSSFTEVGYTTGTGIQFLYRDGNGATVQVGGTVSSVSGPVWLSLTRVQGVYTAAYSTDDITFTTVGTYTTDNINESCYAGLVVSSHDTTKTATATFSNVMVIDALAVSTTEVDLTFTEPWMASSDTLVYGSDGSGYSLLADVPAGTSTVALTSLTGAENYTFELASSTAVVAAGGTTTGSTPPALPADVSTVAPSSTVLYLWQVTADSSLSAGISAAVDTGSVTVAHEYVYAADSMEAAQLAGISVNNFAINGKPAGGGDAGEVVAAGNTGNTAPAYEESLASLLGISGSAPIVGCEDGSDGDFNDSYAQIYLTEI
jgi:autotransporter-associated beta strand protein